MVVVQAASVDALLVCSLGRLVRQICGLSLELVLQLSEKVSRKAASPGRGRRVGRGLARCERLVRVATVFPLVYRAVNAADGTIEPGLAQDLHPRSALRGVRLVQLAERTAAMILASRFTFVSDVAPRRAAAVGPKHVPQRPE